MFVVKVRHSLENPKRRIRVDDYRVPDSPSVSETVLRSFPNLM